MKNGSLLRPRIAIIGAGFSGIILGQELQKFAEIKIFEKARGCGGRMSTRRVEDFAFDHGAQCFSARGKEFQNFLRPHILAGDVLEWHGKVINFEKNGLITPRIWFETHFVAVPGMNSLCKKLAAGLEIKYETEIAPLKKKSNQGWRLEDKNGQDLGTFDFVISTAPPIQTVNLFGENIPPNHDLQNVVMQPCFALMLGFKEKLQCDWIFAKVHNNPIKLIALNSSKPGRNQQNSCFVVHSKDSWSKENLERDSSEVQEILAKNFSEITGIPYAKADYIGLHRWRYALVEDVAKNEKQFIDLDLGLAATSDWSSNSRIEDVWLSSMFLMKNLAKIYG